MQMSMSYWRTCLLERVSRSSPKVVHTTIDLFFPNPFQLMAQLSLSGFRQRQYLAVPILPILKSPLRTRHQSCPIFLSQLTHCHRRAITMNTRQRKPTLARNSELCLRARSPALRRRLTRPVGIRLRGPSTGEKGHSTAARRWISI